MPTISMFYGIIVSMFFNSSNRGQTTFFPK